jgi:tetratricopeptide (TPR) repeat protein
MTETYQPGTLTPLIPEKKKVAKGKVQPLAPQLGSRKMIPLIPPPPAPVIKETPANNPLGIALLNLSGLGLGYLFMHRWIRWAIHFVISIGLVVAAFLTKGHNLPWLWAGLFILFPLWMAFDGWRLTHAANVKAGKEKVRGNVASWAIGGAALFVVVGIYAGYTLLGKSTFNKGMAAYQESNCVPAQKYFSQMSRLYKLTFSKDIDIADLKIAECDQVIAGDKKIESTSYEAGIGIYQEFLKTYPDSSLAASVNQKIAMAYLNWGMALRTSGKFADAIDKFQQVKTRYPETALSSNVDDKLAATTLLWANDLRNNQNFAEAIAKYQSITNLYPATSAGSTAGDEIAKTYSQWAGNLRSSRQYQDAIGKYTILQSQFQNTPEGKEAGKEIANTYLEWINSMTSTGDFLGAMDMITTAKKAATDPKLQSSLDQAYQAALTGLSQDSGIQGTQIVNETVTLACDDKPASSPAVGLGNATPKAQFCGSSDVSLPSDLYASTPAEIKYVLKFDSGVNSQSCGPYYGSSTGASYSLTLDQYYWVITVISTATGKIVNSNTFYGDSAGGCPDSYTFTIGSSGASTSGGFPDESVAIAWLQKVIK